MLPLRVRAVMVCFLVWRREATMCEPMVPPAWGVLV